MILVENLLAELKKNKINYFAGVPDSVLKHFTNYLEKNRKFKNLTLVNEGSVVAAAIGYYLATQKIPCVYMQNSGLGNSINPLISIAHNKVYQIPMLLVIGWRGAPKLKDEPQHLAKGQITVKLLKLCGIKFCILNTEKDLKKLKKLINFSRKNKTIIACLIKNNTLQTNKKLKKIQPKLNNKNITRAFFVESFLKCVNKKTKIISSTGYLSREVYSKIQKLKLSIDPFYMVGGMGHTSAVSLGYALESKKQIICLDGDGSFLMHMGSALSITKYSKNNFKYILLNNKSHESVGGQSTNIDKMNLELFSKSVGYKKYFYLNQKNKSLDIIKAFLKSAGPSFLEVNIKLDKSENKLPRPKDLIKVKKNFLKK